MKGALKLASQTTKIAKPMVQKKDAELKTDKENQTYISFRRELFFTFIDTRT